jgi:glycosyltransferase involved in cell wall biosynthesis
MPELTLFLPMYDERESLRPTIARALQVLASVTADFELLIVDDGSSDGSEHLAQELAATQPRLRVLRHERNQGYGQALRTGFAAAQGEVIAYTDCDEPADLGLLPEALRHFDDPQVDMVIGYRTSRARDGLRRRLYSLGYNALVRRLFGVRARDVNFSFKLIRREALRRMQLGARTGFVDGELLTEAARLGLRIVELPVEYRRRRFGRSHFDSPRIAFETLCEIYRYWKTHRRLG